MSMKAKYALGSLILVAAVMTARHLHQSDDPAAAFPSVPPRTRPALVWQISPASSAGLTPIEPAPTADSREEGSQAPALLAANGGSPQEFGDTPPPAWQPLPFRPAPPAEAGTASAAMTSVVAVEQVAHYLAEPAAQHTIQFGETLPQIAERYLGSREAYLRLYQANLDVLASPAEAPPGVVLRIPPR